MAGIGDWILPIALIGGAYYEFVIRNGQDIQNLLGSVQGAGGGGTPCMGKDSTGAACPCTTSAVAYSYPVFAYRSRRHRSRHGGKGGGGRYGSSSGGGGGGGSAGGGGTSAPASTGNCDCSACQGGTTATTTGGGSTWAQDPAFPPNLACPTIGQPCSTPGQKGGTSGPNKWCICGSGAPSSKNTSKNIKSQSVTGGVATVEGYVGSVIANMGLPATLLHSRE